MDKKYIEENEIEIKYLREQLSAEELEEFEVYLMDNPAMLEALGVESLFENHILSDQTIRKKVIRPRKTFDWIFERQIVFPALALIFGALYIETLFGNKTPLQNSDIVFLSQTRNIAKDLEPFASIGFSKESFRHFSQKRFIIVLEVSDQAKDNYRVEISQVKQKQFSGSSVIQEVTPDEFGSIPLILKTKNFPPSSYLLKLDIPTKPESQPIFYVFETRQEGS